MFVLNYGMQKSASTLLSRFARDVVYSAFPENGQEAFESLIKSDSIPGVANFPWPDMLWQDDDKVELLLNVANESGPFVLHSHMAPPEVVCELIKRDEARALFSIRDPRDVILSLIDHGEYNRKQTGGKGGVFEEFTNIENTISFVEEISRDALIWIESGLACVFRYEDLVSAPGCEIGRLAAHIGIDINPETVKSIVNDERRKRGYMVNKFNKGLLTRYKDEMTPSQIKLCNNKLGEYVIKLGYSV